MFRKIVRAKGLDDVVKHTGDERLVAHVNSHCLAPLAQDSHYIKPVKIPAWLGKSL